MHISNSHKERLSVDAFIEIDKCLNAVSGEDLYTLYEILHAAAVALTVVDSFYVALYFPDTQTLCFPYNFDGEMYDGPIDVPLGDGPTSRVVRRNEPFHFGGDDRSIQDAGIAFGDTKRVSLSAVHTPIRRPAGVAGPVLGVISAQSYTPRAYDESAIRGMQWLADRAGLILWRKQEREGWARRLAEDKISEDNLRRQMQQMSAAYISMLQDITKSSDHLRCLLPADSLALREAFRRLSRACNRAQTEIGQQAHFPPSSTPQSTPSPSLHPPLTPQERDVLRLLTEGLKYSEIALRLHVSVHTVKFHCKNIFLKLQVTTRAQAVHAAAITPTLLH